MKPPRFDYHAPASLDEALELLAAHGGDAKLLAGGQSLIPALNFRLARPAALIDLNRIAGLDGIETADGRIVIGALTRQRTIEDSGALARAAPLLHEATRHIAHLPIRSRGTIGGSLANADPAAEDPAVAVVLGATMVCRSARGERRIPAGDFFVDVLTTALEPDEALTAVEIPVSQPGAGWGFAEISRREGDFALAGAAAMVALADGRPADVRVALCGVGPAPRRIAEAEAIILDGGPVEDAAAAVAAAVDPHGDVHASAAYRRRLAGVVAGRALAGAIERAGGRP